MKWTDEEIGHEIEKCFGNESDLFLVDAQLNDLRGGWQLIVRCESDKGITVSQLSRINRSLRDNFTLPGLDNERLSIEVTSPGVSYPINTIRHFRRFIGHQLKIKHRSEAVESPLTGKLIHVSEEALELEGSSKKNILRFDDVIEGKVKLQW